MLVVFSVKKPQMANWRTDNPQSVPEKTNRDQASIRPFESEAGDRSWLCSQHQDLVLHPAPRSTLRLLAATSATPHGVKATQGPSTRGD